MTRLTVGRDAKQWELYRDAADRLTRRGVIRYWDDTLDLAMNSPFSYSFVTNDDTIVIRDITIESARDKAMEHATFELFEGGAVSGGTDTFGSILNLVDVEDTPFLDNKVLRDVTIDTPGTLRYKRNMVGHKFETYKDTFGPFVLDFNTLYQVTLTNIMMNNDLLKISMSAVRIE